MKCLIVKEARFIDWRRHSVEGNHRNKERTEHGMVYLERGMSRGEVKDTGRRINLNLTIHKKWELS